MFIIYYVGLCNNSRQNRESSSYKVSLYCPYSSKLGLHRGENGGFPCISI